MISGLKALRVYVETVEFGSMSKAAKNLNISTSGVSQQLSRLEQDLEVNLLHRNTRKLTMTEAGEVFYHHCIEILRTMTAAQRDLDTFKQKPLGSLRLYAPVGFAGSGILSKPLKHLLTHYEHLNLELTVLDEEVDMVAQRIDIALKVGGGPLPDSTLIARHVGEWSVGLFSAPGYLEQVPEIREVADLTRIDRLQHMKENYPMLPACRAKLRLNNMQALTQLTVDGLGVAVLPLPETKAYVEDGKLVQVLPELVLPTLNIYALTTHKAPHPAKITAALAAIESSFQEVP